MPRALDVEGMWGPRKPEPEKPPEGPPRPEAEHVETPETPDQSEGVSAATGAKPAMPRAPRPGRSRAAPIRRGSDIPIRATSPPGATAMVERCYVLAQENDRLLHRQAARTDRTLSQVLQDALDSVLGGLDEETLEQLEEPPVKPGAAPAADRSVRRTLTIRSDQDRLLRRFRLLFGVQASEVVRQALRSSS